MRYYFATTLEGSSIKDAIARVTAALAERGFGVLTRIDVDQTLRQKVGAEFRPYVILGACHPHHAFRALQVEDKIGTMLPCNVIVQEIAPGRVEVAAVDPVASMAAIDNPRLAEIARTVQGLLRETIGAIAPAKVPN
jgi:uncharacterized protein (DUF302 family)